ncbi:formate dehydrogenase accessory sulfurtransferase FdhD [Luteolibacter sp. SL250]|uniref:formate dehydrogenase accessory sulfurtransferase FdhD n=1 Tax=Luteolibacter sp. SL250 TaxID=2995170 RepID=UPI00226F5D7D|nr:formate dehydrogenase accessory sulfurtransferase FdhD [Luteolibacter sp. SL250]WAC18621.1 formate dehydrogenase accessory sulfurtransferase FdhD [Luteolibacter sp. SL250]
MSHIPLLRQGPDGSRQATDALAVEEPLELRLDGHAVSVLMRTPGHDEELAAGFLITEGIVHAMSQVRRIEARRDENRVLVFLEDGVEVDLARLTRHLFTGSSCGLCGKATLEAILTHSPPIPTVPEIADEVILSAPERLRASQSIFDTTGGLHAAGIFSITGELLASREDIGRHNAVDKVIGRATMDGMDLAETFLLVSGRASFEIMQKALAARIPLVAAVSAPSSLAVEFAKESGQGLIGFLRPPGFNRYA